MSSTEQHSCGSSYPGSRPASPSLCSKPDIRLKENPLSNDKQLAHKGELFLGGLGDRSLTKQNKMSVKKRDSVSSIEQELGGSDRGRGHQQDRSAASVANTDTFDTWLGRDSKWRQSPEGGEDVSSSTSMRKDRLELSDKSLDVSMTSSNVHLELLDSTSMRHLSSNGSSPVMKEKKKHKDKVIGDKTKLFLHCKECLYEIGYYATNEEN